MRIVFMGTPTFAVPSLRAIVAAGHTVVGVVTQPDREKDRRGNLLPTPVKQCATELGLPIFSYEKVSDHASELAALRPDIMITAAYGQLLRPSVLDIAPHGVINVHASLLPKYRGSSPIATALMDGETETGVTIMQTAVGMDTGDILAMRAIPVSDEDTAETLTDKLSRLGAALLVDTLPRLARGEITPQPQEEAKATYCRKFTKADGDIDWTQSAEEICRRIRACVPWPIAYTTWQGQPLKIYAAQVVPATAEEAAGTVRVRGKDVFVHCGRGVLKLLQLQLPGKKILSAAEFLCGHREADGSVMRRG